MGRFERFCPHDEVGELGGLRSGCWTAPAGRGRSKVHMEALRGAGQPIFDRPAPAGLKIHLLAAAAGAAQSSHSAGRPCASRLGAFQGHQITAPDSGDAAWQGRWSSWCSSQLNALLRGQHNDTVKAMRDEIAVALRRTGAYLSHLGRLKLGVASRARAAAPLSGVKIQ